MPECGDGLPTNSGFGLAGLFSLAEHYRRKGDSGKNDGNNNDETIKGDVVNDGPETRIGISGDDVKPDVNDLTTRLLSVSETNDESRPLILRQQREMVSRFQPKPKYMMTFMCARDFRRDEFAEHAKFSHDVIEAGFGGWVEKACPNSNRGCTFICRPLAPSGGRLAFDEDSSSFVSRSPSSDVLDASLDQLPDEILESVFRRLDGTSLNAVSVASKRFRDICFGLLEEKGMVVPVWTRIVKGDATCSSAWRVIHHKWCFSSNTSSVSWTLGPDAFALNQHLAQCPVADVNRKTERTRVMFIAQSASESPP